MLVEPPTGHACHPPERPRVVTHPMPAHWSGGEPGTTVPIKFDVPALPGTLWRCPGCQSWWVSFTTVYRGRGHMPDGTGWRLVAKWGLTDRKLRRKIAAALAAEQEAIVAAWPDQIDTDQATGLPVVVNGPPPMPPPGGAGVARARR
jgi:hypothetical protein